MKPDILTTLASRLAAVAVILAIPQWLAADIPVGYYSRLTGKATADLKNTLHEIINPHTEISSYSALPSYFERTDLYPQSKRWWDMYSDIILMSPSFKGLNREHSFPKSWWGGDTDIPAYIDLNHLYPAEAAANMAKSNYPLGTVTGTPTFDNGISRVGRGINSGGAAYVFEPDDEYKGDFARTYFYMVTCYQNLTWKYQYMARNGSYPSLQGWAIDLLLAWHRKDPVSQKEIDRNEAVYKIQSNRNPFIDYPDLAEYIWGNRMGQTFTPGSAATPGGDPVLTAPAQGMALDFNDVAIGRPQTAKLFFKGQYLTGSLEISISGDNASYFKAASSLISASLVNADSGYWLNVTYTPTAIGQHTARLRVQDGGLVGSLGIELRGNCLSTPTLTALTATAATEVTSDSYVANWNEPPTGEVADYYVVTRTRFTNGNATVEELQAEENYLLIDDFNGSDSETYSVQSVRLGYRSPASNIITVAHATLGSADADTEIPLAAETYEGGLVRILCGAPLPDAAIFDASGKAIITFPTLENATEIHLPPGVYILAASQRRTPVKICVR